MESQIKKYSKLELPDESAWDKKKYDPVLWLYNRKEEWPRQIDMLFDLWFVPKRFLLDLKDFFKRLYIWIPVLWKDRDWDDSFIFEILKTKLLTQREYLISNYRHTNIPETNRDITICLNLIERVQKSYYEVEYFDYYEVDLSFLEVEKDFEIQEEKNKLFEMKSDVKRDNLLEYIDKYPLDRKRTLDKMNRLKIDTLGDYRKDQESRQRLALYMSQYRHEKCKRLVFLIFQQKIESWWD